MGFLSAAALFFGYMLMYAATANGGRYAANPWRGLFNDAYLEGTA